MNILVMIDVLLRYSHNIVTTGPLEQTLHTADAVNPLFYVSRCFAVLY